MCLWDGVDGIHLKMASEMHKAPSLVHPTLEVRGLKVLLSKDIL